MLVFIFNYLQNNNGKSFFVAKEMDMDKNLAESIAKEFTFDDMKGVQQGIRRAGQLGLSLVSCEHYRWLFQLIQIFFSSSVNSDFSPEIVSTNG